MTLLVVKDDPVDGTDTHHVSGKANDVNTGSPVDWSGTGSYPYAGAMTGALSDFVRIDGAPVALTTSESSLNAGETGPAGRHAGPNGSGFTPAPAQTPTAPIPLPPTLKIDDEIGTGVPGSGAGSGFVKAGGTPVLLDGDPIDTCDGLSATGNSTVTAEKQAFVNVSE
jgi:hypothetical protein